MTVHRYISTMIVTTLIFFIAIALLLWRIDPFTASFFGLLLFYVALFFGMWGTAALLGFLGRFLVLRQVPAFEFIGISLRQGIWVALLTCLALFLLSQNLFELWMGIPLIIAFASIEGFFLARSFETARARKIAKRRPKPTIVD